MKCEFTYIFFTYKWQVELLLDFEITITIFKQQTKTLFIKYFFQNLYNDNMCIYTYPSYFYIDYEKIF